MHQLLRRPPALGMAKSDVCSKSFLSRPSDKGPTMTPTTAERPSDVVLVSQPEFDSDPMLTTNEGVHVGELFRFQGYS